tara:strand:- start:235 stop:426 length:192 start_codon:yes stop_codon:yes gene_type:complete
MTKIMEKIKIKQVRSSIKNLRKQKLTLLALGLRGIGKEVVHENTPNIRGMIERVNHLVEVTKI